MEVPVRVLVINGGSSSLKAAVVDAATGRHLSEAFVERIGGPAAVARVNEDPPMALEAADHVAALRAVLPGLVGDGRVDAVGHRVVHGGERFSRPVRIDDEVVAAITELVPLAPLHNPANLDGIRAARQLLPGIPHVAVFDTAFHSTLPRRAYTYALPEDLPNRSSLRRFGFHGTSHAFVARRAAAFLDEDLRDLRVITVHLGNGSSVCAVEYGRSIETSMGMTPLEGLVMGTRVGDLDPGLVLSLIRDHGMTVTQVDQLLNKKSGLAGLSGVGNDLRDIEARAAAGDDRCRLAIGVFTHRIRKYVGAYAAVMGGVDAIVFTGGIGENSAVIRQRVCQNLEFLGARLDAEANRDARVDDDRPVARFSLEHSRVRLLAVRTDESRAIAEETARLLTEADEASALRIPVAISARHVHLSQEHVEALFGVGHRLTARRDLSQPGQFACEERVDLEGPRGRLERVVVIGPTRGRSQVEISRTDEFALGLDAPIRMSGDLDHTPGITLVGPAGRVALTEGVICSQRHIHMSPADAERFGVDHKDVVEVALDSDGRDLVFGDVVVRVGADMALEMHVDTDEGNAAELVPGVEGVLATTGRVARIRRREHRLHP